MAKPNKPNLIITAKTYEYLTTKLKHIDKLLKKAKKNKDEKGEMYWSGKKMLLEMILDKIEEDNHV